MLGDVLLIEDKHRQAAQALAEKILQTGKARPVIAISGESGSGKSELAHCLARAMKDQGIRAKVIHSDNYYFVPPEARNDWRKARGPESIGPEEYDWDAIHRTVSDFRAGSLSEMPCIDLVTDQVDTLKTDFSRVGMLIIDGLYAIATVHADMRVLIDITYHETKKAQLLRGKEKVNEWRMTVLEQEHRRVSPLREKADWIVDGSYRLQQADAK